MRKERKHYSAEEKLAVLGRCLMDKVPVSDLRESMKEAAIEVILERAKEQYPQAKPLIISDNGPQFIA
jgi:beta-glucosidase/6-phospho-beta-glucosidase/beta-galactosidase